MKTIKTITSKSKIKELAKITGGIIREETDVIIRQKEVIMNKGPTIHELLYKIIDRLDRYDERLDKVEQRIDKLIKDNNLKE